MHAHPLLGGCMHGGMCRLLRHVGKAGRPRPPMRRTLAVSADGGRPSLPHDNRITSTSNPYVKHLVKVRTSTKYRSSMGSVILAGQTLIEELSEDMASGGGPGIEAHAVFVREDSDVPLGVSDGRVVRVSEAVMRKLTGLENTQSVSALLEMNKPEPADFQGLAGGVGSGEGQVLERLVVLDGLQDPGNVGTIMRTAMAMGWDGVFLLDGCCDPFNDKAVRASRGAAFRLPLAVGSWGDLEGVVGASSLACYAADMDGTPIHELRPEEVERVALVMGNEGHGPSKGAARLCRPVTIPMPGDMESLNVAVAAGILLYQMGPSGRFPNT